MSGESQKRKTKGARDYSGDYVRKHLFIADMLYQTKYGAAQACGGGSAELARYAAKLQRRGDFEFLLLSGGKRVFDPQTLAAIFAFQASRKDWPRLRKTFMDAHNFLSPEREAHLMRRVAIEEGVDPAKIIVEGEYMLTGPVSTNTAQNVENLIEDENLREDLIKEGVISVLAHAYHTRRTCGTWLAKMSQYKRDFTVVARSNFPFGFDDRNWDVPGIRQLVYKEAFETDLSQPHSLISRKPEDVKYYSKHRHRGMAEYRQTMADVDRDIA